jgi:hypothetical protein
MAFTEIVVDPMSTVLDALLAAIQKAAGYNRDDAEAPAVVLWTDEKREWEPIPARFEKNGQCRVAGSNVRKAPHPSQDSEKCSNVPFIPQQ